jgi:hypothetical protein
MKHFLLLALILWPIALAPMACTHSPSPVVPAIQPTPTFTPTATFTPSCGFTPVAYSAIPNPGTNFITTGNYVIQNAAQWTTVNPSVPAPAVNFNQQMILEVAQTNNIGCLCTGIPLAITSVCFYVDHIEVDYANVGVVCPVNPIVSCNTALIISEQSLASVPQSNLPIIWVGH